MLTLGSLPHGRALRCSAAKNSQPAAHHAGRLPVTYAAERRNVRKIEITRELRTDSFEERSFRFAEPNRLLTRTGQPAETQRLSGQGGEPAGSKGVECQARGGRERLRWDAETAQVLAFEAVRRVLRKAHTNTPRVNPHAGGFRWNRCNGPNRTRTCDLVVISDALCQLSYEPGCEWSTALHGPAFEAKQPRLRAPNQRAGVDWFHARRPRTSIRKRPM